MRKEVTYYKARWGPEHIGDLCRYYLSTCGSHSIIFNLMVFQTQRQHEGFSPLAFLHCSHRHTVFSSPLAINISRLLREEALTCAYLCVDLWRIRNHRADPLRQLFMGKQEFVFPPPCPPTLAVLCATHSAAQTNSVYSACQERLVPKSWNQGRLYFKPFFPSPVLP